MIPRSIIFPADTVLFAGIDILIFNIGTIYYAFKFDCVYVYSIRICIYLNYRTKSLIKRIYTVCRRSVYQHASHIGSKKVQVFLILSQN